MCALQVEDIQGIVLTGYGNLARASFLLLSITGPEAARQWLGELDIRSATRVDVDACSNIALTRTGMAKLGVTEQQLAMFAGEFYQGMAATDHRRRILGDVGDSDPQHWRWGGPRNPAIDILLMCYGANDSAHDALVERHQSTFSACGLAMLHTLDTSRLPERKEHFGFRDGIAQPAIEGFHSGAPAHNTIAAGEFILGYRNAYGQYTDRPLLNAAADPQNLLPAAPENGELRDFGRNGTYLVLRQLSQDVPGFWRYVDAHSDDANARVKLASKMVGRWPSGAPLVKTDVEDRPELGRENDFLYYGADDGEGLKCPIGAHVRRTNPRDALDPEPGSERAIEVGKRHRIIRRGRTYGPPVAQSMEPGDVLKNDAADEQERGLHFLCFNTHIGRQFEFIQHTWVNNPKFDGLYEDDDPLIGARVALGAKPTGAFTWQAKPVRKRVADMPRFVQVKGGAYFFMPGLRALSYLSSLRD